MKDFSDDNKSVKNKTENGNYSSSESEENQSENDLNEHNSIDNIKEVIKEHEYEKINVEEEKVFQNVTDKESENNEFSKISKYKKYMYKHLTNANYNIDKEYLINKNSLYLLAFGEVKKVDNPCINDLPRWKWLTKEHLIDFLLN